MKRKNVLIFITILIIFSLGVIHFIFFFFLEETDFSDIFDSMESSPLFEFKVDSNCGKLSNVVFHRWEGLKKNPSRNYEVEYSDKYEKADIKILYGKKFCYNKISYKELLYNGQIRKKEEQYDSDYTQDCGIIDTLNQHLYIEEGDKCPIYDVGIEEPDNLNNYDYIKNEDYYIYYNKEDSNTDTNKKIIGKLILSDGQPCYKLEEKPWRKFSSDEAGEGYLKCKVEIFGKLTDERYINKGDITYDILYRENLISNNYQLLKLKLNNYKVSLFQRVFLGIDKACDMKNEISRTKNEKLAKYQKMEKVCLLIEGITTIIIPGLAYLLTLFPSTSSNSIVIGQITCLLLLSVLTFLICLICQAVFLGYIVHYSLSYNCSDVITNELLKKEEGKTKRSIIFTAVSLGLDIPLNCVLCILASYISDEGKEKDTHKSQNISEKDFNQNNSNRIDEKPINEVKVDNKTSIQEGQINKPIDSNKSNSNSICNSNIPAVNDQGPSSETKI